MAIVKSNILKQLSKNYPNFLKKDLERFVNIIFNEIKSTLKRGERVEIRGFGVFSTNTQKARISRNPKTGEITKPAEVRVREYYRDNPQTSDDKVSLKGDMPQASGSLKPDQADVKTAKTQKETIHILQRQDEGRHRLLVARRQLRERAQDLARVRSDRATANSGDPAHRLHVRVV